jgi:endonuclease/exonuclease/phosphatase (EEP) superfamily protein YafD
MDGTRTHHNQVIPRTNKHQVRCIQINSHHSRNATDNLMKKIYDEDPDIILIQEPYEYQSRITGIDKKYRIFTAGAGKHRQVIIIINNNIDAILITKVSDEDTVFIEIT